MTPIRTPPQKKPADTTKDISAEEADLGVANKDFSLDESVGFIPEEDIVTFTGPS